LTSTFLPGQLAQEPPAASGSSGGLGADGLPSAAVAVAGDEAAVAAAKLADAEALAAAKKAAEAKAAVKKDWRGRAVKPAGDPSQDRPDAAVPALPTGSGGAAVGSSASVPSLDDLASGNATGGSSSSSSNSSSSSSKGRAAAASKGPPPLSPPVVDGTLRHMCAFQWRDLGDSEGGSFRHGDTVGVSTAQIYIWPV
jgi:hypothetical protein